MIERLIRRIRRMFFRRVTQTLTMQGATMRLVVLRGREVIHWAVVHGDEGEQGATNAGGEDVDLAVVHATRLRGFWSEGRFRSGRLVTDLPLFAPVSRRLELPRISRRYMKDMVVSQLLETIPFTADEADIAWKQRVNGYEQEIFATAVAKEVIDDHVGVLREAGLLPDAVYSKATALAWAAGVADVIVVHIEGLRADIVLVKDAVPQLVHQVELPEQDTDSLEQTQVISMAVEQVISNGFPPGAEREDRRLLRVVVTGTPSKHRLFGGLTPELVGRTLGREVLPLGTLVVHPEAFSPDEYSVNLGLALADQAGRKRARKAPSNSVPTVNLLPDRHVSRPRRVARFAVFLAILLSGLLAFQLSGQVTAMESDSSLLSRQVDSLQVDVNERRAIEARSQDMRARTETVMQLASEREAYIADLRGYKETLLLQMETMIGEALPAGVSLSELALLDSGIVVEGSAGGYLGIFKFKEILQASGIFADVRLTSIQGLTQNSVDFELVATAVENTKARAPP